MTKHTPTPWESYGTSIRTAEYDIANFPRFSKLNPDDPEQEANAAFIVRSCNVHNELVDVLTNAYQYIRSITRATDKTANAELNKITAALAKAKE